MKPLVSIVVPCYNAEKWVAEAIQSCLDQTYSPTEVIVIDDGSTDRSLEVIKSFGDKIRWETGPNRGGCVARNRGLELSKGSFIKFLDADDVLVRDCIEKEVSWANQCGPRVIIFGERGEMDEKSRPYSEVTPYPAVNEHDDPVAYLLKQPITTPSVLHRKMLLEEMGGFRIEFKKGQEADLHLRLALAGVKFCSRPDTVYYQRMFSSNDRVSVAQSARYAPDVSIENLHRTRELLAKAFKGEIPRNLCVLLGRNWWSLGREMFRVGQRNRAQTCFREAVLIANKNVPQGSWIYQIVVGALGPMRTEGCFETIKSLLKRLRPRAGSHT